MALLSHDQKILMDKAKQSYERCGKMAKYAEDIGLTILAGFIKEAGHVIIAGIHAQLRALNNTGLANQIEKTIIEKNNTET